MPNCNSPSLRSVSACSGSPREMAHSGSNCLTCFLYDATAALNMSTFSCTLSGAPRRRIPASKSSASSALTSSSRSALIAKKAAHASLRMALSRAARWLLQAAGSAASSSNADMARSSALTASLPNFDRSRPRSEALLQEAATGANTSKPAVKAAWQLPGGGESSPSLSAPALREVRSSSFTRGFDWANPGNHLPLTARADTTTPTQPRTAKAWLLRLLSLRTAAIAATYSLILSWGNRPSLTPGSAACLEPKVVGGAVR
mmetsp:Transcript_12058/g.29944  ORF Transcript_12058/g.29944 Transcript_12058/m.29944 type:complete len:260 (-) Transcript_12058:1-780(-)